MSSQLLETKQQIRDFVYNYVNLYDLTFSESDENIAFDDLIKRNKLKAFNEAFDMANGLINTKLINADQLEDYINQLQFGKFENLF